MILTVTLNPLLEHRFTYKSVKHNSENRNPREEYKAGGKGINVSRQLNLLSLENLAFTFIGGLHGKILKKVLTEENINFTSINTESETRTSAIIVDESKQMITSYFGNNPKISISEVDEFKQKLEKMIQNCEMVVFSGSSPCENTNSIFPFGIQVANNYDKISVCDTYGEHLKDCIAASPTILHNNIDEVEKSLNTPLKTENAVIKHLQFLYSKNIKQAFITDGGNDSYASNFDFMYKIVNPNIQSIDSTGSGDSFVAGIAYGWHNNMPFEEVLRLASALGSCNAAKYEVCNITLEEANRIKAQIEINSLGKKLRLTDAP
ncbi:MAG: 1-phosphofructokinase [Ignavibacteriaceae bacterium]|nr:1-phosphofructokinase [Ignavibacteriaceae bacterium]